MMMELVLSVVCNIAVYLHGIMFSILHIIFERFAH